ncbi:MAG: enoyl-CoA hydratase [Rhizobiales bacterium]|nr:enoyl-CoA hydratase [Hyphomicrobiales bacterium]
MSDKASGYETLLIETHGRVGLIRFNRPQALNAINRQLLADLDCALTGFEADREIGAIVIMGSEKAFAAGADIREMAHHTYPDTYLHDFGSAPDRLAKVRKPVIAAVAGFALGGGCELAMMCDFIIAAQNAKFGQPEIKLGVMPGFGGSQRLTRAIGKAKAMDLCLTGRMMDAEEAERAGLVSRIVPVETLLDEALAAAATIADFAPYVTMLNKEAVNAAFETTLAEGIHVERRLFQPLFGTEAQKEGMAAFIEKRKPDFRKA